MRDITFADVDKDYGKTSVVKKMNVRIKSGERLILLGPSGCGKSTMLRLIAGLEDITRGSLYFGRELVNAIPAGKRNVAMVFQNYALYPHMTVADNITYSLGVQKLSGSEITGRLQDALAMLNLSGLEKRKPRELSGGQRQRVALARALVKRSEYFLLDEPLSNLDAQLRVHARKELVKIHQKYGQTFIYVTHDQIEAMTMGDRIALMFGGNLQMIDTPLNVYNRPANIFTAKFIGAPPCNTIDAYFFGGDLKIGRQFLRLPYMWQKLIAGQAAFDVTLGLRPEHTLLSKEPAENSLAVKISYIEEYGGKVGVYFNLEGSEWVSLCERHSFTPHESAYLTVDPEKIHLFDQNSANSLNYPPQLMQGA